MTNMYGWAFYVIKQITTGLIIDKRLFKGVITLLFHCLFEDNSFSVSQYNKHPMFTFSVGVRTINLNEIASDSVEELHGDWYSSSHLLCKVWSGLLLVMSTSSRKKWIPTPLARMTYILYRKLWIQVAHQFYGTCFFYWLEISCHKHFSMYLTCSFKTLYVANLYPVRHVLTARSKRGNVSSQFQNLAIEIGKGCTSKTCAICRLMYCVQDDVRPGFLLSYCIHIRWYTL